MNLTEIHEQPDYVVLMNVSSEDATFNGQLVKPFKTIVVEEGLVMTHQSMIAVDEWGPFVIASLDGYEELNKKMQEVLGADNGTATV